MFWIQRVLFELGAFRKPNQTYTLDSLIDTLNIQPGYRIPVSHWLRKLLSDGLVEQAGDSYFSKTAWCDQAPDLANKGAELSDVSFIVEYISRCGEMAPAILRGEASSLDTLFPGGSLQLAEHIYEHWALSRYFSGILRSALESVVRTLPHGRQLRIVEIGAGTGGSTSALLPLLPPTRTLYCFTDRSTFFLDRARQKYQAYPFLRFELLDIEKNTTEQGFGEHEFDVVVASNVLHATRNLGQTIENVSKLLGPGGLLLLCEVTRPRTWIEFTYGLIEGWSIFDDGWRQDGPLLSQDRWEGLLRKHGFEDVAVFPELGSSAEILGEHCIIALAPAGAHASRHDKPEARISELTERSEADHDQATGSGRPPKDDFVNSLRLSLPGQRREQLVEFVRNHTMRVLRRNSSEPIDSRRRLMDLGIDSLMAVELRNTLSTDLGLLQTLPATLIFDYPNVEAIADFLTRTLNLDRNETDMDSRIDQQLFGNTAESQTAKLSVENLSDEEVEQLLLKRLGAS
jgi:SAM-dependent methyltransferase/acyl carrier protein